MLSRLVSRVHHFDCLLRSTSSSLALRPSCRRNYRTNGNGDGNGPRYPHAPPSSHMFSSPSSHNNDDGDGDESDLFSPENVEGIHSSEVERMKIVHSLLHDHAEAVKKGISEIDPSSNPIIDPRSFEIRRLPKLPVEILRHFREELPADTAEHSRPVFTREIWDSLNSGQPNELLTECANVTAEWDKVDAKTMTKQSLIRRGRAHHHMNNANTKQQMMGGRALQRKKKKMKIVLRNDVGKVEVDVRAVATLNMFISESGKILPRRKSHLSAKSQKMLSKAIKRARWMALINPAPKGPSLAELAAMHTAEELDVGPL